MAELVSEIEFYRIEAEKQHEELLRAIRAIAVSQPKVDLKPIEAMIQMQTDAIRQLTILVQSSPKPEDYKPILHQLEMNMLRGMKTLKDVMEKIPPQYSEWDFDFIRNKDGSIKRVKATAIK